MPTPSSPNVTILVVEDNPLNQRVLLNQLAALGYPFDLAADGWMALKAIATHHYDIILMDCHLPGLDGYATSRQIRQVEARNPVPHAVIIAITAAADDHSRAQAFAAGMDDFLRKPISKPCLQLTLDRWIRRRGLTAALPPQTGTASNGQSCNPRLAFRDHLDWSQLAAFSEQDEGFERSLLHLFLDDSQDKLCALREAVHQQDSARVEQLAHALKGASASIGAGVIWAIASDLELQARQRHLHTAHQQIDRMEASLQLIDQVMFSSAGRAMPEADAPQNGL